MAGAHRPDGWRAPPAERRGTAPLPSAAPRALAARGADAWRRDRHPRRTGARAAAATAARAWNDLSDVPGWPAERRRPVRVRLAGDGSVHAARHRGPPLRLRRAPEALRRRSPPRTARSASRRQPCSRASVGPASRATPDAPAPLTTAEQQRFDAGRGIYEAMCQACHQADGRGQPGRAASLIGSPLALATPDVPGAHPAQRQGRQHRVDAVARRGDDRRAGRERADVRAARMGPWRQRDRCRPSSHGSAR